MRSLPKGLVFLFFILALLAWTTASSLAAPLQGSTHGRFTPAEKQEYLQYLDRMNSGRGLDPSEKARFQELQDRTNPVSRENPLDNQGGPDAFGYFYMDNVAPDTATYSWIELRGDPDATWINSWTSHDDGYATSPADIGFDFPFYGQTYSQFTATSNGQIEFGAPNGSYYWTCLPQPALGPVIMGDMYDAHIDYGGSGGVDVVGYKNFGTYTVIEYDSIGRCCSAGTSVKWEAILYNTGRIKLQYNQQILNGGTMGTVGLQNPAGDTYLSYRCQTDGNGSMPLTDGLAIWWFQPAGIPMPPTNFSGTVNGSNVTLTWTDPTQDTNGDPVAIDNIQVWLGPVGSGQLLATVNPGVQTYTQVNAPDGSNTYNIRAFNDPYYSSSVSTTEVVGNPSYAEDFDLSDGGFVPEPATGGWEWGAPVAIAPHSSPNVWGAGLGGSYPSQASWYVTLDPGQPITNASASVEVWINYNIESYFDVVNFQISVDQGASWAFVVPEGGYPEDAGWNGEPGWSGSAGNWQHVVLPIGAWVNETPIFRFHFESDPSVTYTGFCFDDMIIWGLSPPVFANVTGHVTLDGGNGTITQVQVQSNGIGNPQANPAANGNYTLTNVLVGDRRIIASLAGYHSDTLNITVPESGYTGANLTLRRVNPPQPTGLTGSVNSSTGIVTLDWDNSTDPLVDFYNVYRKLSTEQNWTLRHTNVVGSANQDTLTVAGIYMYRVTAVDDDVVPPAVESDPSSPVTVLFGNLPPTNLSINGNFDDRVRLSWLTPGTHPSYQIFYDDSTSEIFMRVTSPNQDHDYFATRFTPPSADTTGYPLAIQTACIYMERSDPLPNVWIAPDAGGIPDTANAWINWQEIGADGTPGWLIAHADGQVMLETDADFWVIWQFPPQITGPGTGTDWSAPDSRSYWTYDGTPGIWNQWTSGDWMARVWVGGPPGWGFVMSSGSPSGYSIDRVPTGQTAPTAEMMKMANREFAPVSKGPARAQAMSKAAGTTTSVVNPFPLALDGRLDGPYSQAPALVYQERDHGHGGGSLDDIQYYKVFRDNVFLANDTTPPYDDVVGSANENVNHTYFVRAHYDNNQDSDSSNHATGHANMAPAEPTNLAGNPIGQTQMHLTWTDPTLNEDGTPCVDLTTIHIYRDGAEIGTVNAGVQSYNDTPPQANMFYAWTVSGADEVPNIGPVSIAYIGAVVSPWETVDYEWIDISSQGTSVVQCDDCIEGPFPLGFDFEYYGQTYTSVYICSNGWVNFAGAAWGVLDLSCPAIPDPQEPNGCMYGFMDDLLPSGGQCKYFADAANGQFIVAWNNCPHYGSGEAYTFEIIIGSNGSVTYEYQTIPINNSTIIGVENADGTMGLEVNCHGTGPFTPADQTAISFWGGPSGELQGVVRAFTGNVPIEGVMVQPQQVPDFALTDANGFYSLPLDPGTYTVCFSHAGFCDTCFTNILVEDNSTTVRNATLRSPAAQFSVTSLTMTTWPGHDVSTTFEINNPSGQCPLDYTISDTSAWLSTNPVSGSVPPNQTATVTVMCSAQGLAPGSDHQSALVITHEAQNSPMVIPVSFSISLGVPEDPAGVPTVYALHSNYPNPFNATTEVRFDLPQAGKVKLAVFNVMGQEVARVADGQFAAGRHRMSFDATDLPSGMYLLKMEAGSYTGMQKMLLLK